jgi:dihydrofolate synthase/folylpolyglutamate synthase
MPATLEAWLALLELRHPLGSDGIDLGLARVRAVKERLGQGGQFPIILVAGTNGKGSTCAMLDQVLRCAGYRVGLYSSPHLLRYNERVGVNGQPVSDADLCEAFERVEAARADTPLTYFEFGTLAAWEVFVASKVDVAILEVGLGGRLDATNVYDPSCCIVTTVDLDHMEYLGPDRESIGAEKAGIFRSAVPAICGDFSPPQSLVDRAGAINTPLHIMGRDFGYLSQNSQWLFWQRHDTKLVRRGGLAYPGLRGNNQLANAACAMAALALLNAIVPVAMKDIRRGLLAVELSGRFQILPGRPTIVLDVAHNPQAARILADNLGNMTFHPRTWAVFGMLVDKDVDGVIDAAKERVTHWLPCDLAGRRAASADFLASRLRDHGVVVAEQFSSAAKALDFARVSANEDDRILVFGSFLTVAAALHSLGRVA